MLNQDTKTCLDDSVHRVANPAKRASRPRNQRNLMPETVGSLSSNKKFRSGTASGTVAETVFRAFGLLRARR